MKIQWIPIMLLCLILLLKCNNKEKGNVNDIAAKRDQADNMPDTAKNPPDHSKLIRGIWGNDTLINAAFVVKADSVFYPDRLSGYAYTISRDSFIIYYDNHTYKGKLKKLTRDSLVTQSNNNIQRYRRQD